MDRDPLECNIIKNCAATLAGLGTAGIFNSGCPDRLCLEERLIELNRRLSPKGVMAEILLFRENTALVYVYRPGRLARCLEEPEARRIFSRVRHCTQVYQRALEKGASIDRLTVPEFAIC